MTGARAILLAEPLAEAAEALGRRVQTLLAIAPALTVVTVLLLRLPAQVCFALAEAAEARKVSARLETAVKVGAEMGAPVPLSAARERLILAAEGVPEAATRFKDTLAVQVLLYSPFPQAIRFHSLAV